MAHQDYVSKKRAPAKKKNPYQAAAPEPSFSLNTKIVATITLVALLGFIGILLYVKQAPAPESMVPVKPEPKVEQPSLPKPPKEKWSYMTDLKTKQVEEGHYEVNTEGPYKMQCGSFKTQNQAEILKAKIAFVGIEAKISKSQGQNGLWYKVVLGPYAKKRLAESDKHKLKSNDVNGCQIWLWQ